VLDPAQTDAELASRDALRELVGEFNGPMERHGLRVFLLAQALAAGQQLDRELLLCAAYLHDIGLYPGAASKAAYVTDSRLFATELLARFEWAPERLQRLGDAIELHHTRGDHSSLGAEVELLRRADLIEVSQGVIRFGLSRGEVNRIRTEIPVKGFVPEVLRGLGRAAIHRPRTLPRIFKPR
jgi:hypothetical protein